MFIKPEIAQCIVKQLKGVIDQDINFITVTGNIIASTNSNRINTYHEAAVLAVKTNQKVIIEFDGQYEGTRKGINLLLRYKNKVIGVIGITGDIKEVLKYGEIIQKMAEVLIIENYSQALEISRRERDRYIIEGIFQYSEKINENEHYYFNFLKDNQLLRTLVIKMKIVKQDFIYFFENSLIKKFQDDEVFHFIRNENLYYILTSTTNEHDIQERLSELQDESEAFISNSFKAGVGNSGKNIKEIQKSFKESVKSLEWNTLSKRKNYSFYKDLDLGAILTAIPIEIQKNYAEKIIGNIPDSEVQNLKDILYSYGKYNRSITTCANKLHMHKNTFQYQLNKIQKYTAFNPRRINEYTILKIAFLVHDLSNDSTKL